MDRKPASSDKAADDARAVLLKLISLQKGDPRLFTASIPELANHRYWEISELALSFLKEELNKSLPNTFVLNALLPTIGRLGGDAGQISEFNRLHSLAYSELPGKIGKSSSYVVAEFDKAASGMTRQVANPRLPAAETFTEWAAVQGFKSLVSGTEKSLTDAVKKSVRDQTWVPVLGRDSETTAGLDVLVRIKGRVPTFMGEAGVGKTDVAKGIAYRILMGELPDGIHKSELNGAVILLTSASRIAKLAKSNDDNSMAEAIETYLGEVKAAERKFGKPVIVFIDEAHTLSKGQLNGLKPLIESDDPVRLIFATTGKEMGTSLAKDDAIMRRIEPILVEELTPELTADILRKSWVPVIEKKYNTKISDELLKLVISTAPNYRPNVRRPEGPIKLLQDLAIQESRLHNGALTEPGQKDLFGFLKEKLGMPVMVEDRPAFVAFIENLKVDLRKKVIGQGEMIDGLVDTFASGISRSGGRQHASVVILGTTGVGKTMIAEQIGEKFYGSKNRILEIDMTAYMDGGYSMNALFGAPNGVISSDKDKGILCEFFEGRGKGGGVLILNEVEKAHP
ncbi:MAG: ATP-dependent Clp protease ATP-binding subunit, partial [Cryobacterium sp.]|nr:ATP-dependent Clp protease ATP-binding subunit [Oligoflexia bacterium]